MLKSKFKFFALLITVCMAICAAFAGCLSAADYEEIYNDDGKIAGSSACTRIASVETSLIGSYKLSCGSLSGCYIAMNSFKVDEGTSATLSLEVESGKCKVVLVKDKTVYTVTEGSYDGEIDFENIPQGKYKLKVVGVDAEFKLTLTY